MKRYGVTLEELVKACERSNTNAAGSYLVQNGQEYIVRGVEDGEIWSTRGFKRVKYSVDAKRTQGSITYRPLFTKETFTLHWVKEDGAWKEDWVTSAADFSRWGRAAAKEENVSEDDFVLFLLDEWMGIEATEEIWNPVR